MRGVKKLENQPVLISSSGEDVIEENVFLIDWLTFVSYVDTVDGVKRLLGLDDPSIPWQTEVKFRNGYPKQCYWNFITISYGADDEAFYDDPKKARSDMGICVNLSGQGCRAYETYGSNDWFSLLGRFFSGDRYNVTRLDIAYDDHTGVLDIFRIANDVKDRNYISSSKKSAIEWSDNQLSDIRGLSVYVGSKSSDVLIRIYDKAAERGFKPEDKHWIRVELQLRHDRALVAAAELVKQSNVGSVSAGVLRNYLTFRVPTEDTNKSRWPMADYWEKLLQDMQRISLWISPGEPYNFSKTERWLTRQCGFALLTYSKIHTGLFSLVQDIQKFIETAGKDLPPKYKRAIETARLEKADVDRNRRNIQAHILYNKLLSDGVPEQWLTVPEQLTIY